MRSCEPAPSPNAATTPAQSEPGGPGSPGYTPSTLSTSRKLRPTARTCSSTCGCSMAGISPCGTMRKLLIAPRASKCSRIGPVVESGASARRGTRRTRSPTATSSSSASPPTKLAREASSSASPTDLRLAAATSRHERRADGCSDRTVRDRPIRPPWAGRAAVAVVAYCVPAVRRKAGTGREMSCCFIKSKVASMVASTPAPAAALLSGRANMRLLDERAAAAPTPSAPSSAPV
mmetsp:Transcript_2612/g.8483  ORF Transcript_2612/g.8483 Transcript_2612/m.8483 type:complete len:234 (+) Transcript_2612:53-754(+)